MKNNHIHTSQNNFSHLHQLTKQANDTISIPNLPTWQPTQISNFPLKIDKNGNWYHQNTKMTRQSLINLFAKVLWRQSIDGIWRYFLKTPSDLYAIDVEDVPLFIHLIDTQENSAGQNQLIFYTTTGDCISLDDQHIPYFAHDCDGELCAYVPVRYHLSAKIMRNAFYHLTLLGEFIDDDASTLLLTSGDKTYALTYPDDSHDDYKTDTKK